MIKEAYVSYEIAKLLKEKGFDEYCDYYYDQSSDEPQQLTLDEIYYSDEFIKAPTHQTACAWLRDVHNIFIEISVSRDLNGNYHYSYSILNKECKYVRKGYTDFDWNYEDAVEVALKYALENLI